MSMDSDPRSLTDESRESFLVELNALVEDAAESRARSIVNQSVTEDLVYPPGSGFTPAETEALLRVSQIEGVESALRKVIADACADAVFHALCIIDGVGDPRVGPWRSVALVDRLEEDEESDSLHDGLHDSYWKWREMRPAKGWSLDAG